MSDSALRLVIFFSALVLFSALEFFYSYRQRQLSRKDRWPANLGLIVISTLLVKALLPTGLVYFTDIIAEKNIGLLNIFNLNLTFKVVLSLVFLDFSIYIQHILFHKINFLWKFHRVHHADIDLDTTSSLRFHPVEIVISIGYKIMVLFLLGIPAEAVVLFEIILNLMAMFNHSNLHLPAPLEKILRHAFVTPQMHIVHHSVNQRESDKNFGFNLSIWDRLFGTYIADFKGSDLVGQSYYRKKEQHRFLSILLLPFKRVD